MKKIVPVGLGSCKNHLFPVDRGMVERIYDPGPIRTVANLVKSGVFRRTWKHYGR